MKFNVVFAGNPSVSVFSNLAGYLEDDKKKEVDVQAVVYTNSKTNAKSSLYHMASGLCEKVRSNDGTIVDADTLTGGDGLKRKAYTMYAVTNYVKSYNPRTEMPLDKIKIVVGTEAMNAGISSDHMKYCMYRGPPPNLYILFQTLGRVNRRLLAAAGDHVYEIHLSLDLTISVFVRVRRQASPQERLLQQRQLMEVISFLVFPKKCYHSFVASYFEHVPSLKKSNYQCCAYCRGDHKKFTGIFMKEDLKKVLIKEVVQKQSNKVQWKDLKKIIKAHQAKIFKRGHAPGNAGPIHALILQLLCSGLAKMKLKDDSKAGSEDISENDVIIELSEKFLMGPDWTGFTCQYVVNYFIMFVHLIIVQQNYCVARQKPNLTNFEQLGTFLQFWTKNGPFWSIF